MNPANTPHPCSWMPDRHERKCQDSASHFHHAYGEVCPHHAAVLMAQGEKVARLLKHRTGVQSRITQREKEILNTSAPRASIPV